MIRLVLVFAMLMALASPVLADDVCPKTNQESVITNVLKTRPDYLVKELDGNNLQQFWNNLRAAGLLLGDLDVSKIYVLKSDNNPDFVYLFFLKDGCIVDVKMTKLSAVAPYFKGTN